VTHFGDIEPPYWIPTKSSKTPRFFVMFVPATRCETSLIDGGLVEEIGEA
jgi:hypothetical protein